MALHCTGAQASDQDRYWSDRDLPEHTGFLTKDLFILNDWNESKGTAVVISINMKMYTCSIHNSIL